MFANGHAQRVVAAIHALRGQFAEAIRVDELAAVAQMSPSAFHRQFKALTAMTPLQYQKQLRLLEARHLMTTAVSTWATSTARQRGRRVTQRRLIMEAGSNDPESGTALLLRNMLFRQPTPKLLTAYWQ
ncbi:AraC family transcriptional regulator [Burkholderia sp. BCC0419]|uniref:helix-turn-helix domain-containing protein n=1 Tax=Burkholderia sp. BCC0419 TaxID=486878 RepID=UPI001FC868E2|nr:AraC family transcriptional regulator [Burkholderia sp. BCC0419]